MDQPAQPRLLAFGGAARRILAVLKRPRQAAWLFDRHDDARHALRHYQGQSAATANAASHDVQFRPYRFCPGSRLVDRAAVSKISEKGPIALIVRRAELNDARGIAKVQVDTWRTTYKGIISDEFLAALWYEQG